jgi:hypothetical protein
MSKLRNDQTFITELDMIRWRFVLRDLHIHQFIYKFLCLFVSTCHINLLEYMKSSYIGAKTVKRRVEADSDLRANWNLLPAVWASLPRKQWEPSFRKSKNIWANFTPRNSFCTWIVSKSDHSGSIYHKINSYSTWYLPHDMWKALYLFCSPVC